MVRTPPLDKLTDTIFGFALAVGALSLTVRNPQSESEVIAGLFIFGLSFVILIVIWWGHHDLMSQINTSKPKTIFLNIILLFFVHPIDLDNWIRENNFNCLSSKYSGASQLATTN